MGRPLWRELSFAEVERLLEHQKARKSRIPLLDRKQLGHLPPSELEGAVRIIWSNVSSGYEPTLTRAWMECMGRYQQEARLPRLVSSSLFWVITRSLQCFY